jgi:hypothetical protein
LSSHLISKKLKIKIYGTVIFWLYCMDVKLCPYFEEHKLKVFENRLLRIFGPRRKEDGLWRKLHNELHSPYYSPNVVRMTKLMRWAGHVAHMGEGRGVYRVLVGRPKGKRPLGRPRCRWEDNIKMDLREIGIYVANWIWLAEDRVQWRTFVNIVMNFWVP